MFCSDFIESALNRHRAKVLSDQLVRDQEVKYERWQHII